MNYESYADEHDPNFLNDLQSTYLIPEGVGQDILDLVLYHNSEHDGNLEILAEVFASIAEIYRKGVEHGSQR